MECATVWFLIWTCLVTEMKRWETVRRRQKTAGGSFWGHAAASASKSIFLSGGGAVGRPNTFCLAPFHENATRRHEGERLVTSPRESREPGEVRRRLSCSVEQSGMVSFLAWGHMFYSCSKCCWLDTDVPNVFLSEGGHHAPNPQLFFVKPGPPSPPATLKDQLRPLNRAAQVGFFSEIQFWVCFFLLSQNQTAVSTMVSFVNCILFSRVHFVIGLFWVPHPPPNPQHVNCTFDGTLKA